MKPGETRDPYACPRLRPLEVFRTVADGREAVALRDPTGITRRIALIPPPVALMLSFMNGTNTVTEIQAAVMRHTGEMPPREQVEDLVRQLDEALLLETPRFEAEAVEVERAFRVSSERAAAHAGRSYPAEAPALRSYIDGFFPDGAQGGATVPRAILSPHIDFSRGGKTYGHAYQPLRGVEPPDLFVVFGTDHNGPDFRFTLTKKHYETPMGRVETDEALVDELVEQLSWDEVFREEAHHRAEHSIEFQAVMLRHIFPKDGMRILPVLCGSMNDHVTDGSDPRLAKEPERFFAALAKAVAGRRVCWVAGADLAHVGPRFGDAKPLEETDRERLRASDDELLSRAIAVDADGFFSAVARVRDRNRVCGTSAIYAMLRMLESGSGRVVAYDQCPASEDGGSLVSIASAIFD